MGGPDIRTRAELWRVPRSVKEQDETVFFVAAVAAALVEHRRVSGQANPLTEAEGSRTNWRMVARLERLRGGT
jgi:hypothetical protein